VQELYVKRVLKGWVAKAWEMCVREGGWGGKEEGEGGRSQKALRSVHPRCSARQTICQPASSCCSSTHSPRAATLAQAARSHEGWFRTMRTYLCAAAHSLLCRCSGSVSAEGWLAQKPLSTAASTHREDLLAAPMLHEHERGAVCAEDKAPRDEVLHGQALHAACCVVVRAHARIVLQHLLVCSQPRLPRGACVEDGLHAHACTQLHSSTCLHRAREHMRAGDVREHLWC